MGFGGRTVGGLSGEGVKDRSGCNVDEVRVNDGWVVG